MIALQAEKPAQKKKIEKLARRLAEQLSARESSLADKRHMNDALAAEEKLVEQIT